MKGLNLLQQLNNFPSNLCARHSLHFIGSEHNLVFDGAILSLFKVTEFFFLPSNISHPTSKPM